MKLKENNELDKTELQKMFHRVPVKFCDGLACQCFLKLDRQRFFAPRCPLLKYNPYLRHGSRVPSLCSTNASILFLGNEKCFAT